MRYTEGQIREAYGLDFDDPASLVRLPAIGILVGTTSEWHSRPLNFCLVWAMKSVASGTVLAGWRFVNFSDLFETIMNIVKCSFFST